MLVHLNYLLREPAIYIIIQQDINAIYITINKTGTIIPFHRENYMYIHVTLISGVSFHVQIQ